MRTITITILLAVAGCGDDGTTATDTSGSDTSGSDTTGSDTTGSDTSVPDDTAIPEDTAVLEDTAPADTFVPADTTTPEDTRPGDVATGTCGCGSDAVCLQATEPEACATVAATCTGGLQRVDACATDDVMASCEKGATIQYLYWARIEGWIADAAAACASAVSPGTFSVATVPEPEGAPCSCQRSAAACVQTYGDLCDALSCEAGAQATECATADRVPGRCVTRDGQREIFFYGPGADEELAETTCLGASATEYYWFPEGF